jgi:hypothetical protein
MRGHLLQSKCGLALRGEAAVRYIVLPNGLEALRAARCRMEPTNFPHAKTLASGSVIDTPLTPLLRGGYGARLSSNRMTACDRHEDQSRESLRHDRNYRRIAILSAGCRRWRPTRPPAASVSVADHANPSFG